MPRVTEITDGGGDPGKLQVIDASRHDKYQLTMIIKQKIKIRIENWRYEFARSDFYG